MATGKKKALIIAGGIVALVLVAAVVVVSSININAYKTVIETEASGVTGLDVRINGKMGFSLLPFGVSAADIHVSSKGIEILSLENLKIGVELIPLLKKRLKITGCELVKPAITIVKYATGKYNFEGAKKGPEKGPGGAAFSFSDLKLSRGDLVYIDRKTGEKAEIKDFNLAVKDLSAGDAAAGIINNVSFTGSFDCKAVEQKDLNVESFRAQVKAVKGTYSLEPLAIGTLVYIDRKTGEKTELKEIRLAIRGLTADGASRDLIKDISCTGSLKCKELEKRDLRIGNISSSLKVDRGAISLTPFTMDVFGAKAEGEAVADESAAEAVYKIDLKIPKLDFEKLQEAFGKKRVVGGKADLEANLTIREKGGRSLMSGMDGTLSLRGDNLVIYTMDIDKVLSSLEASQKFNLVDLGAFFIAGPLGSVVTKGYHYGDVYNQTRGGQGAITRFVSHWKIRHGVADATDCAFATRNHRVALKGRLDLVGERYDNVTVALLDGKGCATFRQNINGPFGSPKVGSVSAGESLAGPVINLFRSAKSLVQGGKCEVFYNGAVRQP